jgi:hypothetical protein
MLFVQRKLACSAQILFEKLLKNCMFTRAKSAKRDVFSDKMLCFNLKDKMVNIMKNVLPNNSYESLGKLINTLTPLN